MGHLESSRARLKTSHYNSPTEHRLSPEMVLFVWICFSTQTFESIWNDLLGRSLTSLLMLLESECRFCTSARENRVSWTRGIRWRKTEPVYFICRLGDDSELEGRRHSQSIRNSSTSSALTDPYLSKQPELEILNFRISSKNIIFERFLNFKQEFPNEFAHRDFERLSRHHQSAPMAGTRQN